MTISIANKNFVPLLSKTLAILLLLVTFWVFGKVLNQLLQPAPEVVQPALQKTPEAVITQLAAAKPSYLLGQPQAQPVVSTIAESKPAVQDMAALQTTRLNLKLTGILYTPKDSVAIIEEGVNTLVLREGEAVRAQVFIEQIEPTFVVLDNRGKLEKLQLQESEMPLADAQQESAAAPSAAFDQAKLEKIRNDIRQAPLALNRYVRFRSIEQDGRMVGLQVWPRKEREIFEALGFKSGDKIIAVDGVPLSEMGEDPKMLQQLLQKSEFRLQIERRGERQDLSVSL